MGFLGMQNVKCPICRTVVKLDQIKPLEVDDRKSYYYNTQTGETQCERPRDLPFIYPISKQLDDYIELGATEVLRMCEYPDEEMYERKYIRLDVSEKTKIKKEHKVLITKIHRDEKKLEKCSAALKIHEQILEDMQKKRRELGNELTYNTILIRLDHYDNDIAKERAIAKARKPIYALEEEIQLGKKLCTHNKDNIRVLRETIIKDRDTLRERISTQAKLSQRRFQIDDTGYFRTFSSKKFRLGTVRATDKKGRAVWVLFEDIDDVEETDSWFHFIENPETSSSPVREHTK